MTGWTTYFFSIVSIHPRGQSLEGQEAASNDIGRNSRVPFDFFSGLLSWEHFKTRCGYAKVAWLFLKLVFFLFQVLRMSPPSSQDSHSCLFSDVRVVYNNGK